MRAIYWRDPMNDDDRHLHHMSCADEPPCCFAMPRSCVCQTTSAADDELFESNIRRAIARYSDDDDNASTIDSNDDIDIEQLSRLLRMACDADSEASAACTVSSSLACGDSSASARFVGGYLPRRYWLYPSEEWLASRRRSDRFKTIHSTYAVATVLRQACAELAPRVRAIDPRATLIYRSAHLNNNGADRDSCSGAALVLDASEARADRVDQLIDVIRSLCSIESIAW